LRGAHRRGWILAPEFSVIIVNWNARRYLPACLEGVRGQRLPPREVIVLDNASSDDSVDYLRVRHPEVKLIALERNLGFAAANNLGVRQALGDWVVLLNPDAFPEPGWLAGFAAAIGEAPEAGCFAGKLVAADDSRRIDGTGDLYHVSGLAWRRDHGRLEGASPRPAGTVFSACGASAAYRRDLFLELGGFDESFFCYMEDVDLGFRLRLRGHDCRYVPQARARHVGSGTTGRRSDFSVYQGHRNLVWVFVKNMPGRLFWLCLPLHLALNLVTLAWLVFRGQGRVALRAKRDAVRALPRVWHQRGTVQAGRRVSIGELRRAMLVGVPWPR
jgi:GT2 family glycosyltransferase